MLLSFSILKQYQRFTLFHRNVSYIQGQVPEPKIREYFYYIDHQGMLFLDDAKLKNFTSCLKEKKFLHFFFTRIKLNDTNRYQDEFPFISICGRERNFIRCDDVPCVYTHIINKDDEEVLSFGYAHDLLKAPFLPNQIYMSPGTGRVYHPASERYGNIGLIRSKLAIEVSKYFEFCNGEDKSPTHFTWNNIKYSLDSSWIENTIKKNNMEIN